MDEPWLDAWTETYAKIVFPRDQAVVIARIIGGDDPYIYLFGKAIYLECIDYEIVKKPSELA